MTAPSERVLSGVAAPSVYSAQQSAAIRRKHALRADFFGALAVLVVVLAVGLWVRGGGIQHSGGPGGLATSVGRLTGLTASALLLVQVLLMARIPWVEQAWGQDVLARRHRWVGFLSFDLMLVHVALITLGYAQSSRSPLLGQAWTFVVSYPGMLLATAGTLALVTVTVSSIRAARRRLRYESWHLLHLYAYLGVGLALPHQLWTGVDFTSSALATAFWWTLWAVCALAVLLFRVLRPMLLSVVHRIRVEEVIDEGPGVVSIVMSGRNLDRMRLKAGQFCQWRFLCGRGSSRAHPFSISAMPTPHRIRITAKALGDGSRSLKNLPIGTRVLVEGPYGIMTADRRSCRDVLMISAGIGITPMRALAEEIAGERPSMALGHLRRPTVVILHRIQALSERTFAAEFDHLSRTGNLTVIPLIGRRGAGSSIFPGPGAVDPQQKLPTLVPDLIRREVYLCGPKPFMREAHRHLLAAGVPEQQIHKEEFAW